MEFLGIYYWYVKIPQYRYMEHELKISRFMLKKNILHFWQSVTTPTSLWQAARNAHICEAHLLIMTKNINKCEHFQEDYFISISLSGFVVPYLLCSFVLVKQTVF